MWHSAGMPWGILLAAGALLFPGPTCARPTDCRGVLCASPQQCGGPWLPALLVFIVMISSVEPNWSSLEVKLAVVLKITSVDRVLQPELGWLGWVLHCLVISCPVTSWCLAELCLKTSDHLTEPCPFFP